MQTLSNNSDLIFVWHDNSGQRQPANTKDIQTTINANGFTIDIAANAHIEQPIIILTGATSENITKNNVNIGSNAIVQIIEYLMCDDNDVTNNIATTINCAKGATLKHCILHQAPSANITQQSITNINQEEHSSVVSNIFAFGGTMNRIELAIALKGAQAKCEAAYLGCTRDSEVHNVILKIDHMVPNCNSQSLARTILYDKSAIDLVGRIEVHPNAYKSFADLQIKNLLCSPKAQANNRPELEIYNDDVHCSHGSSTGQINEEALFYMKTRGLDEKEAMAMIIEGFIQPAIDSCTIPNIADFVRNILGERA